MDKDLARKADAVLRAEGFDRPYHVSADYIKEAEVFDSVTDPVIYVGCGVELSSLFQFENAEFYLHMDTGDPKIMTALEVLAREGVIEGARTTQEHPNRRHHSFSYKGTSKMLVEVFTGEGRTDKDGGPGDITRNVPFEVYDGLGAIYFLAMPYPRAIRGIQVRVLPHLKLGGVFEGPYPYKGGRFEGAPPEQLGLTPTQGTYVKTAQLSEAEVRDAILQPRFPSDLLLEEMGWR